MPNINYEISYIHEASQELEAYLLSKELFWPVLATPPAGGQAFPRLTLGGLLLSAQMAKGLAPVTEGQERLKNSLDHIETLHNRWRSAWENKAQKEMQSRLNQWRNYLAEYRQNPKRHAGYYVTEVRLRVMIQLLESTAGELDSALLEMRKGLDQILRGVFVNGGFIWEVALQPSFPSPTYWYLYGKLRENFL